MHSRVPEPENSRECMHSSQQRGANLAHDNLGSVVDVRGREPQHADTRVEKATMAAVVLSQRVIVDRAVVFKPEPLVLVIQIDAADKSPPTISNHVLRL